MKRASVPTRANALTSLFISLFRIQFLDIHEFHVSEKGNDPHAFPLSVRDHPFKLIFPRHEKTALIAWYDHLSERIETPLIRKPRKLAKTWAKISS